LHPQLSFLKVGPITGSNNTGQHPNPSSNEPRRHLKRVQEEIDIAVNEWLDSTHKLSKDLGERFNKKPRYFLDIFFSGGVRMVHQQEKVNPHNAFNSLKAQELRDGEKILFILLTIATNFIVLIEGHVMSLLDIQATYKEEYNALDEESRHEIVREFKENMDTTKAIRRPSPRGRILDISNTLRNVRLLVSSTFGHGTTHHHDMGSLTVLFPSLKA
jgi:hypothetical protein